MSNRKEYDAELKAINDRVEEMGQQVLLAIDRTKAALRRMDLAAAVAIMKNDSIIDAMETDIEERCIQIVVKQQPVASDWRKLASYMRMIGDLERIADNCSDISIYIKRLSGMDSVPVPEDLLEAFTVMREMVADTVTAFHNEDVDLAQNVIRKDDVIDDLFEKNVSVISDIIKKDQRYVDQYVCYLFIYKYVERMADHTTAIASWITFIAKGRLNILFTDRYEKESRESAEDSDGKKESSEEDGRG